MKTQLLSCSFLPHVCYTHGSRHLGNGKGLRRGLSNVDRRTYLPVPLPARQEDSALWCHKAAHACEQCAKRDDSTHSLFSRNTTSFNGQCTKRKNSKYMGIFPRIRTKEHHNTTSTKLKITERMPLWLCLPPAG